MRFWVGDVLEGGGGVQVDPDLLEFELWVSVELERSPMERVKRILVTDCNR